MSKNISQVGCGHLAFMTSMRMTMLSVVFLPGLNPCWPSCRPGVPSAATLPVSSQRMILAFKMALNNLSRDEPSVMSGSGGQCGVPLLVQGANHAWRLSV